jgi:hypothetical protein
MKGLRLSAAALLCAAAVWAADAEVDGGPAAFSASGAAGRDATMELKWDNGQRRWTLVWLPGYEDTWVGNEFDVSTLKWARAVILKFKFYTRGAWPNQGWDGVRLGFYGVVGGVPGSMLWPTSGGGYFFKPNAPIQGHIWVECDINWTCPATRFVAAEEQYYRYPNCDPFSLDNSTTSTGYSWMRSKGAWSRFEVESVLPYRTLMIRVLVEEDTAAVTPTSLGRVKALYY